MWQAVVCASLPYGTLIVGLKQTGLRQFLRTMTLMQRMLLGDHSFQTHCSHSEFFTKYHLESPGLTIHRMCQSLLHRQTLRTQSFSSTDILHAIRLDGPREILTMIEQMHTGDPDRLTLRATLTCSLCDQAFETPALAINGQRTRNPIDSQPLSGRIVIQLLGYHGVLTVRMSFHLELSCNNTLNKVRVLFFNVFLIPPSPSSLQSRLHMTVFDPVRTLPNERDRQILHLCLSPC